MLKITKMQAKIEIITKSSKVDYVTVLIGFSTLKFVGYLVSFSLTKALVFLPKVSMA